MEISSLGLSSLTPINHHRKTIRHAEPRNAFLICKPPIFRYNELSTLNTALCAKTTNTQFSLSFRNIRTTSSLKINSAPSLCSCKDKLLILNAQLSVAFMAALSAPFPSSATESFLSSEPISNRIDFESVLVSIDDFFNRNPFFVSGVTFIWLIVIPLTQAYLKKFKFISAIDAFRKLQKDSNSQLLDIREKQSRLYLDSPNLNVLNKKTVHTEFVEGEEDGFVKKVMQNFKDPETTTICILDDFDGDSMKVAELLFTKGFKEAYAIRGGLRGKNGWQAIQETLLPPSTHVLPKKVETSKPPDIENLLNQNNGKISSIPAKENGYINSKVSSAQAATAYLSPYPNYPDLKPPSSPTPSKPES